MFDLPLSEQEKRKVDVSRPGHPVWNPPMFYAIGVQDVCDLLIKCSGSPQTIVRSLLSKGFDRRAIHEAIDLGYRIGCIEPELARFMGDLVERSRVG